MAYNYSYCGPIVYYSPHAAASLLHADQTLGLGWALGMQIKHSPQVLVASVSVPQTIKRKLLRSALVAIAPHTHGCIILS